MSTSSLERILPEIEKLKAAGKKIVTTNGCFDILHRGHVTYLEAAKKLGDVLVVGVNSDESVRILKGGGRPVNSEADRAYILTKLKSVDFTFIFNEKLPNEFLQKIAPHVHVKGGDYKVDELPEYPVLVALGAEVITLPFVHGYSTTETVKKLSSHGD